MLTGFSDKLTRRSDYHFLRLAEEEFLDPSAPRLAFHPDYRADRLPDPEWFSAMVVESYQYGSLNAAFDGIRRFARKKPVILIEADEPLFRLLKNQPDLTNLLIVSRVPANDEAWVGMDGRPLGYGQNSVRQTWRKVRAALGPALERQPMEPDANCHLTRIWNGLQIGCEGSRPVPVSVDSSFHPNWRATDGQPLLMLSPSLLYTVVPGTVELQFCRTRADRSALFISIVTLFAAAAWCLRSCIRIAIAKT